ncbi:hypothetical protein [Couchioplanes azureus]|uniref:hypothetical protein n=1 Tax=Couchioplanes caeruleus TaxID=56438 RepID=UPI00166F71B0|nr:hypothetical protein [Couchioplanes caeruleus]GGQ73621.1 hypothetical protein GCM10010166_49670 [Couchioplanes caeruleus subsp. azureus]
MKRSTKLTSVAAGVAVAGTAGVLGLVLAGPALAETGPSASPSASTAAGDREAERAQRQDEFAAALATELGVDKAKVAAALEKVQAARQAEAKADRTAELKTRLDAAVAEGKLTADQAAAILEAAESGVLPQGGGRGGPGGPGAFGGGHGPGGR